MILQEQLGTNCPYCGEPIHLLVDSSIPQQELIEDCQVCCQPMTVVAHVDSNGDLSIVVRNENE